jgi:hypothetical protein
LLALSPLSKRSIDGDLLTQRKLADYRVARGAHYHFTVKGNQPTLHADMRGRGSPDYIEVTPPENGSIETRRIGCRTKLIADLDVSQAVGQVFLIEREVFHKRNQKLTVCQWPTEMSHFRPLILSHFSREKLIIQL